MNPWLIGALAGGMAVPVAAALRTRLRTEAHRHADESGTPTRSHLWLLAALPLVSLLVAHALAERHNAGMTLVSCLSLPVLAALAAIDLDVHRLPDALTYPLALLAVFIAAAASLSTGDWPALLRAVLAGPALGAAYLLLLVVSPGGAGIGLGDVKLAVGLGVQLGWSSWTAVLTATMAGFVLGGVWAAVLLIGRRATRNTQIAFGPFMISGTVLTLLGG
ncbi:prepilin peptidase [Flexivirga caeni]|uniref:Prepilin peptidase n=1 Tax=Flexivirga caeni TaxID=2294115 RepID=A0A3M9MAJ4_9MICO|nr:A24 family peptidase [Flexivirga caeni]RNI22197.1 prepilin peptidase [Flexivirga caeni]